MTVGERIRQRRIELGLSQLELAKRMGLTAKSTVCQLEKEGNNVTTDRVTRAAKALECTPTYLLGWDDAPEVPNTDMIAFLMKEVPEVFDDSFILEYAKSPKHIQEQTKNYLRFLRGQKTS